MILSQQVLLNSKVHKEIVKSFEEGLKSISINGVVESFSCLLIDDINIEEITSKLIHYSDNFSFLKNNEKMLNIAKLAS